MFSGCGNNRPRRKNAEPGGSVSLQRVHVARREVAGVTCPRPHFFVSRSMSKRAYEKIKRGLDATRPFIGGTVDTSSYRVHYGPGPAKMKHLDPIPPGEISSRSS